MGFKIGNHEIGAGRPPFIILEAGINHNGELDKAFEMVRVAKKAGADAVKFQTFKAEEFVADHNQMFTYRSQGQEVTESMLDMFKRYEFSRDEWFALKKICDETGITFMSTPQNISDLDLLLEVGVPGLKVGSDDFTNLPLLEHYSKTGLPLIMSCGMADLGEVYDAVSTTEAQANDNVLLMLCTSQYPTPPQDAHIRRLSTLAAAFPGLPLGFSDHTQGSTAAVLAAALGAVAFEKHFTLNHDLPGPDHWFSETPASATTWVSAIREAHEMLGTGNMVPTIAELEMRKLARRSVTALCDIAEGEIYSEKNIGLLRPGTGLPPKMLSVFLGTTSRRAFTKGEQLHLADIG